MPPCPRGEAALALLQHDASKILRMCVGPHTIAEPGQYISRVDAQRAPRLFLPGAHGTYMSICVDLDAPFASFPFLSPIEHWVQSGLRVTGEDSVLDPHDTPPTCEYIPPGPPPGAAPHRYVVLLYEQPATYDVTMNSQNASRLKRMRFDLEGFEKRNALGEVVAVNYFTSN